MKTNQAYKIWKAPAKLNLFLHITSQRNDGYHELQTVFQFLDYYDELQFVPNTDNRITRHYNTSEIAEETDLIVRAAKLLQQYAQTYQHEIFGVDIHLNKKLPMGGGLGGGSSDAATTLVALNEIWQLNLSRTQLAELGLQLGADVPVFVHGYAVWAEGVGENFTSIELFQPVYVVIIPPSHVSTAELFKHPDLKRNMAPISVKDYKTGCGENVFEQLVRKQYPDVNFAIEWLEKYSPTRMTGTGACVFASFDSETEAQNVMQMLPDSLDGFVARGKNLSPLYEN